MDWRDFQTCANMLICSLCKKFRLHATTWFIILNLSLLDDILCMNQLTILAQHSPMYYDTFLITFQLCIKNEALLPLGLHSMCQWFIRWQTCLLIDEHQQMVKSKDVMLHDARVPSVHLIWNLHKIAIDIWIPDRKKTIYLYIEKKQGNWLEFISN